METKGSSGVCCEERMRVKDGGWKVVRNES